MNRPIRRVALAMLILFGLLIANANYVQVFEGDKLRTDPGNTRVLLDEYERQRGTIVVDGRPVAESVPTDDKLKYLRRYPGGSTYAPVTGFYSLIYGATGIEQAENDFLSGSDNRLFTRRLSALLTGRDPRGGNVVLTLNRRAQEAAVARAAATGAGAVVALDPTTGEILAMASTPVVRPEPDLVARPELDPGRVQQAGQRPGRPAAQPGDQRPLPAGLDLQGDRGRGRAAERADAGHAAGLPDRVHAAGDPDPAAQLRQRVRAARRKVSMQTALTNSYNTAFAKLGVDVGESAIRTAAAGFGIGTGDALQTPLRVSPSSLGDIPDTPALAQSSIGQRDVALTPLQGAMIAAAVSNNGVLMTPYLVDRVRGAGPDRAGHDPAEAAVHRGQPAGRRAADPDDAQRGAERHRPEGPDRRRRRGRQDRHGRERAGAAAARLVHRVRAARTASRSRWR